MPRRSLSPRRIRPRGGRIAIVVATITLALAGCGRNTPVGTAAAATVDGHDVPASLVRKLVDAQIAYGRALKASKTVAPAQGEQRLAAFQGAGVDTFSTEGGASVITSLVEREITREALADAGAKVSEADRASVRSQLTAQFQQDGIKDTSTFKDLIDFEVDLIATGRALGRKLATLPEELCVGVIGARDRATAERALTRLRAGEDFNKVATDLSVQPPTGDPAQDVQCISRTQASNVFPDAAQAKVGDLLGPAQSTPAAQDPSQPAPAPIWLIARVERLQRPKIADLEQQIAQAGNDPSTQQAAQSAAQSLDQTLAQARNEALNKAYPKADVTVDPRYGTWNAKLHAVEPPVAPGATTSTVPVPTADPSSGSTPAGASGG